MITHCRGVATGAQLESVNMPTPERLSYYTLYLKLRSRPRGRLLQEGGQERGEPGEEAEEGGRGGAAGSRGPADNILSRIHKVLFYFTQTCFRFVSF